MTKSIDFYFDFISPYSYLAHKRLKSLNKDNKIKINYKPILLGGLHKLGGITAPAFNDSKMKNMKNDCDLVSKKNNIQFKWNEKFPINSLYIMRGYLLIKKDLKYEYLNEFFNAYWVENKELSNKENMNIILDKLSINHKFFFEGIEDQKIKDELKEITNQAFNKEIFGAPTFIVNNKLFWGQDRLEYVIDEILN